jgi:hypothetical protein
MCNGCGWGGWGVGCAQVCVKYGDTLVSIAREYKTDWLQLWGTNVGIRNPTRLVRVPGEHHVLKLGPTTVLKAPISVSLFAQRFRMSGEDCSMPLFPSESNGFVWFSPFRCLFRAFAALTT